MDSSSIEMSCKGSASPSPRGDSSLKDMSQHVAAGSCTVIEFSSEDMQVSDTEVNILPYLRKLAIDASDWEKVTKTFGLNQDALEDYFARLIEDGIKDLARNPELLASLSQ